jgi:hypothetical protein
MGRLRTLVVTVACCLLAGSAPGAHGCAPAGVNRVTIGTITYVCLVKNEAQVTVMQAPADRYSRFAVANCKCEAARFPRGAARCACRALMT